MKGFRPPMEGETKPEVLTNAGQYHVHSMERRDDPENAIFYGRRNNHIGLKENF